MDTKICTKCKRDLPLEAFNKGNSKGGRRSYCRECEHLIQNSPERKARRNQLRRLRRQIEEYFEQERAKNLLKVHTNRRSMLLSLLRSAKQRAKAKGLEFTISEKDLELPKVCPLLEIPLEMSWNKASDNSFSIDRIDSSKGYIPGNVWIISRRANVIKNNSTLDELKLIAKNLETKIKMTGKFYIYPKNGHTYRVIQEAKMKDPTTGEWKDSVFYTDGDSAYCREKKDFLDKFIPKEDDTV